MVGALVDQGQGHSFKVCDIIGIDGRWYAGF